MKFELFEPRIVFDQSLGHSVEFEVDTRVEVTPPPAPFELPTDVQFRDTTDDFVYASDRLSPEKVDEFIDATEEWSQNYFKKYNFAIDDVDDFWYKVINHNPVTIHEDGYIISKLRESDPDTHSMLTVKKFSECHTVSNIYTRPDYLYRYSFDVRHPETEATWLTQDNLWSIVTQMWGPRSAGPGPLNPPFGIHTRGLGDGEAEWVVVSYGDSREDTSRPYEDEHIARVPFENLGDWNRFDIEYVPNSQGDGLVRVWLNGEIIADWVDIKSSYFANQNGEETGPLNPQIGLYSYDPEDGQEAHFDNFFMECHGVHQSSISGRVDNAFQQAGNIVYATNDETGERVGVETNLHGLFSLNLAPASYTLTAFDPTSGRQAIVSNVSTIEISSQVVNMELQSPPPPPPTTVDPLTFTGDVTGDGVDDVVNMLANGKFEVTTIDAATDEVTTETWTRFDPQYDWSDFVMADFNDDGRQDIAARAGNGEWWVGESTGERFSNSRWAKWAPGVDWEFITTGDFNGDGFGDIVGRAATDGTWWVAESNETSFHTTKWGKWSQDVSWELFIGDFNGDGMDDIAGRADPDGSWWVGESTGFQFTPKKWGKFTQAVDWDFHVGDFNGDGKDDIAGRAESDGSFWIAESQGDRFWNLKYGKWDVQYEWTDLNVADIDGDGTNEIVGRAQSDNSWWVAKFDVDQNKFVNQKWGLRWDQSVDWAIAEVADFDGDGMSDLLGSDLDHWLISR